MFSNPAQLIVSLSWFFFLFLLIELFQDVRRYSDDKKTENRKILEVIKTVFVISNTSTCFFRKKIERLTIIFSFSFSFRLPLLPKYSHRQVFSRNPMTMTTMIAISDAWKLRVDVIKNAAFAGQRNSQQHFRILLNRIFSLIPTFIRYPTLFTPSLSRKSSAPPLETQYIRP